jgi:hypothetical protein
MTQHRTRLLAAASTAATAAALTVSGLAAASAATPAASGTERFQIMTTSSSGRAPAAFVATGVFTAGGVDHQGKADVIVFPGGSFKIHHSRGHGKQSFNPKTCLLVISLHGTYKVGSGAGKYAGISGHGTYHLSIMAVSARTAKGKCTQKAPPVAWEQIIKASGPVTLK